MKNLIKLIKQSYFIERMKKNVKQYIEEECSHIIHTIAKGIKYLITILFLSKIAKVLIEFPVKIAYKYNIELSGEEYSALYGNYNKMFIYTLIIVIVALPTIKLASRLKHASKDGFDFYEENINQNTQKKLNNTGPQKATVQDIIKSNDNENDDENVEENMYKQLLNSTENSIIIYKCKSIKNTMKSLTLRVTNELYINCKEHINFDIVYNCVKNNVKKKKKITEERYKEIAQNILDYLINNDIIESDDMENVANEKYYFTTFGSTFINYFQSGII